MTEIHDHLKTPDLYRYDQVPIPMIPETPSIDNVEIGNEK
jgi:hypothetical protein